LGQLFHTKARRRKEDKDRQAKGRNPDGAGRCRTITALNFFMHVSLKEEMHGPSPSGAASWELIPATDCADLTYKEEMPVESRIKITDEKQAKNSREMEKLDWPGAGNWLLMGLDQWYQTCYGLGHDIECSASCTGGRRRYRRRRWGLSKLNRISTKTHGRQRSWVFLCIPAAGRS
jgi:hypothetical protein